MSVMDIYGINPNVGPGGIDASLPDFDLSIPSDIPGMTRPAINFRDAPVNFMMRQNNPRVFDPMVNIKNFAQNLPTNFSTGRSGIVSALTGLPGLSTALGLFNETPEQKALREFYEATTGLTSTGQIASGIMQGYNPVSGFGPQGLTSAVDQRIESIKNTLKTKKSAILESRLKELEAIKAAEEKARQDKAKEMQAANKAGGTGGYQGGYDGDFMEGSGTAAEMGSS